MRVYVYVDAAAATKGKVHGWGCHSLGPEQIVACWPTGWTIRSRLDTRLKVETLNDPTRCDATRDARAAFAVSAVSVHTRSMRVRRLIDRGMPQDSIRDLRSRQWVTPLLQRLSPRLLRPSERPITGAAILRFNPAKLAAFSGASKKKGACLI